MKKRAICVLIWACAGAVMALANPITFTISTIATGTLGSTPFANALVTFTQMTDTTDVGTQFCGANLPCAKTQTGNTITIAGIGTASLTGSSFFFDSQTTDVIGLNLLGSGDILDEDNAAFGTFNMVSNIGPDSGTTTTGLTINNLATSDGAFSATYSSATTFQATVTSTAPEPGALGLVLAGAIPIGFRLLRRRIAR